MNKRLDHHAERFGLTIVDPAEFGVELHPHGRGQRICFTNGETITDKTLKARIKALVLPPAWRDVKVCVEENGHIQATGRDEKGRLQYRYHDDWVNVRNAVKTERLLRFGRALPKLRKRIARDLKRQGTDRRGTAAVAAASSMSPPCARATRNTPRTAAGASPRSGARTSRSPRSGRC